MTRHERDFSAFMSDYFLVEKPLTLRVQGESANMIPFEVILDL